MLLMFSLYDFHTPLAVPTLRHTQFQGIARVRGADPKDSGHRRACATKSIFARQDKRWMDMSFCLSSNVG